MTPLFHRFCYHTSVLLCLCSKVKHGYLTAFSNRFSIFFMMVQAGSKPWKPPLLVDIGANVGWFSLNGAAAGGRVVAFEAMPSNIALLRRSFCANPWLAERIALFGTGLGSKRATCGIISGTTNKGDGHTVCSDDIEEELRKANDNVRNETYEVGGVSCHGAKLGATRGWSCTECGFQGIRLLQHCWLQHCNSLGCEVYGIWLWHDHGMK